MENCPPIRHTNGGQEAAGKPARLMAGEPRLRRASFEQKWVKEASTFKIAKCDLKARAALEVGKSAEEEANGELTRKG